jgi:hypothetical protein
MGVCIMCGRSDDIEHELWVKKEQKKPHHNWHGNNTLRYKRGHSKSYIEKHLLKEMEKG